MTEVMLRFRQWGDPQAPAVLLWPGGTRSAPYHFDETAPLLAAHGLRVIAVHPPGWATTALPPDGYRPSALARDVLWMLDELGLARVAFAGYSWGAFVASHLAALAPRRLAAPDTFVIRQALSSTASGRSYMSRCHHRAFDDIS